MMLYKLVVLGDGGVGKTALTIQVSKAEQRISTFSQPVPKPLCGDGEGFLLVYSISSRSTFERVERFHDQITRVKDTEPVPLMLVGNKCDKITEREVSREEGMNMARRLKCEFIESSAKTCVNVERAFYGVVKMIRQNREGGKDSRRNKKKAKCAIL
ncbi:23117_t:CDS:2 [Cetraspora pellucida]|uniref:23117_t:CDS:1 n=1 Tax=Cetraspora pellucida TaxID=1433469 RepID=A0A9N9GUC1_9GLOM|nr:23117_t:CDS:2 [Cetraspora pellucida]